MPTLKALTGSTISVHAWAWHEKSKQRPVTRPFYGGYEHACGAFLAAQLATTLASFCNTH